METTTGAGQPIVSRETTAPFLIRAFVKIGAFHRLSLFEDGTLPTTDEQQIFTWKDATLREVLTTLRDATPPTANAESRHPLARFSFRAVYADAAARGRFATKDLGVVYSRDILGEPGSLAAPAPRLLDEPEKEPTREERTLEELRFVPGDYMCIAVLLPKNVTVPGEITIKGAAPVAAAPAPNGWKRGDSGWSGAIASTAAPGRGGGHWRGDSNPPPPGGPRGRGGRAVVADRERDRDRDRDRRDPPPPVRRDPPPHRGGRGDRRGGRSRSRSRSPPPPRRRGGRRYD